MPIHDWSRVKSGIFHDFHHAWIAHLRDALNEHVLPKRFYALSEQVTSKGGPDVLTLERVSGPQDPPEPLGQTWNDSQFAESAVATLTKNAPRVELVEQLDLIDFQYSVVIRHVSDDQVVALVEIVSPGNKASENQFERFVKNTAGWISAGYHVLVVDIHRRTPRDPRGVHVAIWQELGGQSTQSQDTKELTLAAYRAGVSPYAFVQPMAIGESLHPMPLFLDVEHYVNVPLEESYERALRGFSKPWRQVLEG